MKKIELTVQYIAKKVCFLDQRLLPEKRVMLKISNYKILIEAIKKLKIRGAPAIGISGAYGVVLAAENSAPKSNIKNFCSYVSKACVEIAAARPTAVNLKWAVERVKKHLNEKNSVSKIINSLKREADSILEEDLKIGKELGMIGANIIKNGSSYLTHCNAGGLATSGMGSALSNFYYAAMQGKNFRVYVDETRPLLQGARLTSYELGRWGINYTLICDNMAATVMASGKISGVVIGADRIALNGDAANKIGSYGLAVLAKYHKIPFYVAAPYSTFDLAVRTGAGIPIEERENNELIFFNKKQIAPRDSNVFNPAFDVVPSSLITAIITERGLINKPSFSKIRKFLKSAYDEN